MHYPKMFGGIVVCAIFGVGIAATNAAVQYGVTPSVFKDGGFETTAIRIHDQVGITTDRPLGGDASLRVTLAKKQEVLLDQNITNTLDVRATRLTVGLKIRAEAAGLAPRICAVATYTDSKSVSNCSYGPWLKGRVTNLSIRLPLSPQKRLVSVHLLIQGRASKATTYTLDSLSGSLTVPVVSKNTVVVSTFGIRVNAGKGYTPLDVSVGDTTVVSTPTPTLTPSLTPTPTPAISVSTDRLFPASSPWYTDISKAALDSESSRIINGLASAGGWGNGNKFQIDFGLKRVYASASTPLKTFAKSGDFFEGDCDYTPIPIPAGGAIEGESGYQCTSDGDCHLLVVDTSRNKIFEMWRADLTNGNAFNGGCVALWDMTKTYPAEGRGEQCSSADAAGYPISPLLVSADEVYDATHGGAPINHALRFILPNSRIRHLVYVHPATHSTRATTGGADLPPYGAHFRLKANFDMSKLPNDAARAVARALQTYGMFLSDGGNIALTFESDQFTKHKWSDLSFDSHSLFGIQVTDFEMVDGGTRINYTGACMRTPITSL